MRLTLATLRVLSILTLAIALIAANPARADLPTSQQVLDSEKDILGELALKEPGGPSYEFFSKLMPPLRYVDANFHHYPITLSAAGALIKGRLVSNGSSINALTRSRSWINEIGRPVTFYVGDKRDEFGSNLKNLDGPKYADGYLPIVQLAYANDGATFAEEAFASTEPALAEYGAVLVKFTLLRASGRNYKAAEAKDKDPASTLPVAGVEAAENLAVQTKDFDEKIEALIEGPEVFSINNNRVFALKQGFQPKADDKMVATIYPRWIVNPGRGALIAPLKTGESAYLAIFTKPAEQSLKFVLSPQTYEAQRSQCTKTWNDLLNRGTVITTPEAVVNNAWRAETIGNFMLIKGDEIHYSAGNQYDKRYIGEGGDAVRCVALWGQGDQAKKLIPAQFTYTRAGLEFHQAAFKLQMLAHYFRLTNDAAFVKSIRPMWQKEIDVILKGRETENGMFPREKYCGDIDTRVFSLNSNANCWRALRDMSLVLEDIGDTEQSQKLAAIASEYRKIILDTLAKAIRRDVDPPFVPIALSGEENPHDPIWGTTIGSYWNLMIEYVLGSGVFTADSQNASDVIRYIQDKGGLCMGMLRARATPGNFWVYGGRMNDLYGMRYALALLQRDDVDHALVSFYGKLAQGMTRDTFIGCEGSSMAPVDEFGRQMALPPNSAANSNFLQQLRYILVQDYDNNDDGRADTLRLAFATPRKWLADGQKIEVKNAPTEFGQLSFTIQSALEDGHVEAQVDLPKNPPQKTLLRMRLPDGYHVKSATANGEKRQVDGGETIDLAGLSGRLAVRAEAGK